jgi:hypothetical protein
MTRAIPFTQASLRRGIEAVRKAGLHVTGIKPDGTILVSDDKPKPDAANSQADEPIEPEREIVL